MTWSCPTCTFDNENDADLRCSLCEMERGHDAVPTHHRVVSTNAAAAANATTGTTTTDFIDLTDDRDDRGKTKQVQKMTNNKIKEDQPSHSSLTTSRKRKAPPPQVGSTKMDDDDDKPKKEKPTLAPMFRNAKGATTTATSSTTHTFSYKVLPRRTLVEAQQDTQRILGQIFGLKRLRNLQPKAIRDALQLQSQLIVMATGGGKSLCYQLPACLLGGVTIVISPLLALMKDQVEALNDKGIPAACVNSSQTERQNKAILDRLIPPPEGKTKTKRSKTTATTLGTQQQQSTPVLFYITPESIQTERMRAILQTLYKENRLAMFAVDEAHCLSSWGHDFRVSYRRLHYLRKQFPKVPCMACTATATPQVIQDITNELYLSGFPKHIGGFDRENIFYKVKYKDALDDPLADLIKYITRRHDEAEKEGRPCSGIVYVHKRDETSMLAAAITKKAGVEARPYHAGLKKDERNTVQESWSKNEVQVAVATVAFGMGIDLAHVRYVVHWSLPKSIEGFYQESGRAGRDGLPAHSVLYYSKQDVGKFQYLIRLQAEGGKRSKNSSSEESKKAEANTERKLNQLDEMDKYCSSAQCRRNTLIAHFGGTAVDCKKSCDYCNDPKKVERVIASSKASKDIRHQQRSMTSKTKFGDEDGLYGADTEHDHDDNDWGWGADEDGWMVGDLKVTGPLEIDPGAPETSSFMKASEMTTGRNSGGFSKASDILSKYETMEGRAEAAGRFRKSSEFGCLAKASRGVIMPAHLVASLNAASSRFGGMKENVKKKSAPETLTSEDHGAKAKIIQQRLERIKAEREARLKALQGTKTKKPPPPPPAPLSFGKGGRGKK